MEEQRQKTDPAKPVPGPWFRRLTLYSVLGGLCPLIPVPFLDDHVLRRVKRRMVREIAADHGVRVERWQQQKLAAGAEKRRWGCVIGVLISGTLRIIGALSRKLFRRIVVVLLIKDSIDTTSRTFHEGYLLRYALAQGLVDHSSGWQETTRLRRAVDEVCLEVDTRPILQVVRASFRGSWLLARKGARLLVRRERREPDPERQVPVDEEEQLLGGLLDRLTAALWRERDYLHNLENRLAARWAQTITRVP